MPDLKNDYYERNAGTFFADTVEVDMSPLYGCFLPLLPQRAYPGRRLWLRSRLRGSRDTRPPSYPFDASPALVALAARHVGQPFQCLRFQDIAWQGAFDGIWACASPRGAERPQTLDTAGAVSRKTQRQMDQ